MSVCDGTIGKIEGKFDRRDVKSKDPFFDIPSIPPCDLPDLVERKPEPEVLATVLLLSEKDDLRKAKPNVIFDKLFLSSTSHRNFSGYCISRIDWNKLKLKLNERSKLTIEIKRT